MSVKSQLSMAEKAVEVLKHKGFSVSLVDLPAYPHEGVWITVWNETLEDTLDFQLAHQEVKWWSLEYNHLKLSNQI